MAAHASEPDRERSVEKPEPVPGATPTERVQWLFVKHESIIKAFILSLQPNFIDADDVLQETFLVISRKAESFQPGTNFVAWACTIARLKLLEARRCLGKAPTALSEEALEALFECAPNEKFFDERLGALRKCLDRLAPRARELVWLRYHGEHAMEEIAERLSWKSAAVRVALSKARNALRQCVQRQLKPVS